MTWTEIAFLRIVPYNPPTMTTSAPVLTGYRKLMFGLG
jgi:hypothetical protein